MATQTPQQRRTAARKAAATRKRNSTGSKARSTQRTAREAERTAVQAERTVESGAAYAVDRTKAAASQAQRAVLIPVGAALVARDNVVEAVQPFTQPTTAERELKKLQRRVSVNLRKYERRGTTARNRALREV